MARVSLTDDAKEDLRDLDRSAQLLVVKALRKLGTEPEKRGEPLSNVLSGFRKLVVGNRSIRIVYRVEDNGDVCVIFVIGLRSNDQVYEIAKARLQTLADGEFAEELTELVDLAFLGR